MSTMVGNTTETVWAPQHARMIGFDPDGENQRAFAEKHYAVIGGGTVGYSVLGALLRAGAGTNGGSITLWQGHDAVGPENLHSAFQYGDIGKPKVDALRRLAEELNPTARVEIVPSNMEDPLDVFNRRPDFIVSAMDDAAAMARLHAVAYSRAQGGKNSAPIILGTDLGRGGVLIERFNYPAGAPLFNGHVAREVVRAVILSSSKSKDELTPVDMQMRMRLIFEIVGLQNLPSDMLRSLIYMREQTLKGIKTSFPQSPFSGLVVGPTVVNYMYNMANGVKLLDIAEVDARMQFYSDEAVRDELRARQELLPQVLAAFGAV